MKFYIKSIMSISILQKQSALFELSKNLKNQFQKERKVQRQFQMFYNQFTNFINKMNRNSINKNNSQKRNIQKIKSVVESHLESPFSDYEYQQKGEQKHLPKQLQRISHNKNIASKQDLFTLHDQNVLLSPENGLNFTHNNNHQKERSKDYQNKKQFARNIHSQIDDYHESLLSTQKAGIQAKRLEKQQLTNNQLNLQNSLDCQLSTLNIQIPHSNLCKPQSEQNSNFNQIDKNYTTAHSFLYSENGFRQLLQSNQQLQYKISICEYELELLKQKSYQKDQQIRKQKENLKKKDHCYSQLENQINQKKKKIKGLKQGYKNLCKQLQKVKNDEKQVRAKKLDAIEQKNRLYQQQNAMQQEYRQILAELQNGFENDSGELSNTAMNNYNLNANSNSLYNGSEHLFYQINDIDGQIQRLKQQNSRLSKQSNKLQKKLYSLKIQSQNQNNQRSTINNRVKQLNQRMVHLQNQQRQLLYELSQYQKQQAFKEQAKDQLSKNNQQIVELYGKIEKLQRELQIKKNTIDKLEQKYKNVAIQENSLRKRLIIQRQALKNQVKYRSKAKQRISFQVIDSQYGQQMSRQGQFSSRLASPEKQKQQISKKPNQTQKIRQNYSLQYKANKEVAPLQSILSRYQKIKSSKNSN